MAVAGVITGCMALAVAKSAAYEAECIQDGCSDITDKKNKKES